MVKQGETAPDFRLTGYGDGEIREFSLSEALETRPVVLVFYIYDYSPVCTDQMCEVNDMEMLTFNDDVTVFGISTDGPYSHREFAQDNDLSYPLLTDDDASVYEQYGLAEKHDDGTRELKRGIVVIDTDRTVQFRWIPDDNWDEWRIGPLKEANEVVQDLVAGP